MNLFLLNIALAFVWAAVAGGFSGANLAVGFVIGYLILGAHQYPGSAAYRRRMPRLFSFLVYFAWQVFVGALQVALDVIIPRDLSRPGVVAVPLDAKTPLEIMLLSNAITLTPGTMTIDIAPDRSVLFVHAMFIDDPDKVRASIKCGLERRLLKLLR